MFNIVCRFIDSSLIAVSDTFTVSEVTTARDPRVKSIGDGEIAVCWQMHFSGYDEDEIVGTIVRYEPASISDEETPIPGISLSSYPNPFNATVTMEIDNLQDAASEIEIVDITGRLMIKLPLIAKGTGIVKAILDGRNSFGKTVSSGVYFYAIRIGERGFFNKMTLVK